ncbi:MAG TPA: hypothetical protein VIJ39_13270 [Solirubrobacteraceae bacterium]
MATDDPDLCTSALKASLLEVREGINDFTASHFHCLGGRMGSGMGSLMEALWAFYARHTLSKALSRDYEIAWMVDNAYNDFAVVRAEVVWDPASRGGEILRIEAKSMNLDADETKGHFDALQKEIGEHDLLLVLVWKWIPLVDGGQIVYPKVLGEFLGNALEIARLRDALHVARGGLFVSDARCPDGCNPASCLHDGEPLNSSEIRERRFGPAATRGAKISHAANFGGLTRMIKTRGAARDTLREQMIHSERAEYVNFINDFPSLRS